MQTQNNKVVETPPKLTFFILKNGLKLAILHAKNSRKASVSININKGHYHASAYPEGFAHLLEHMLFNASEHYNETHELDEHLGDYHGQINAWTQDETTHFQLSCDPSGMMKACEILLDRLNAPLLTLNDIEKEIQAIDAEFKLKINDPVSRLLSVQKTICNQQHPFSRFSTGNATTFSVSSLSNIQRMLRELHSVVMQGKHVCVCLSLPENLLQDNELAKLASMFEESFSHKPLKALEERIEKAANTQRPIYKYEQMNAIVHVKQAHHHQLMKSYILHKIDKQGADSLLVLLTHMIESKHLNGLHNVLLTHNYITDLHCYYKSLGNDCYELCLSVELSEQGAKHYLQIMQCINDYFAYLRDIGIEKWRFREKAVQFTLQASLNKSAGNEEIALNVSHQMHTLAFNECGKEDSYNTEDAYNLLPQVIEQIKEKQSICYFLSPLAETDSSTDHYQTEYAVFSGHAEPKLEARINTQFALPRQNPFMSGQHALVAQEFPHYHLVHLASNTVNLKFYQDTQFGLASGECYISITDPNMYQTSQQVAVKRVWLACLNEFLAAKFFDAKYASIHFRVYPHHHGVSIHTSGMSERQLLLCIELINAVKLFKASESQMQRHLQKCIARMLSATQQKPFNQLFGELNTRYSENLLSNATILGSLQSLTYADVEACQDQYFAHNYIESLLVGNWSQMAIQRFNQQLNSRFIYKSSVTKPSAKHISVKDGEHIHKTLPSIKEENVIWHYIPQISPSDQTLQLAARSLILEKLLAPISFEVLRQQNKMGYMLGTGYKPIGSYPGIALYIQSPSHEVTQIYAAMKNVVEHGATTLASDHEVLPHLVKELCKQVTPKEKELSQRASRAWLHFEDEQPLSSYRALRDALLATTTDELNICLKMMLDSTRGQTLLTQNTKPVSSLSKHVILAEFY